mmetsp:Transcript_8178/g.9962  ORF Transcript_8178/g.9962 Transcript_8178/m.9962 type:complete len:277 (-) Transcript_8178:372-1202(-)
MAPKRKAKSTSVGSSTKKAKMSKKSNESSQMSPSKGNKDEKKLLFERYADEDEGVITMDGLSQLAEDLDIDPTTDTKLLVLCWRLGAEKPGCIQKEEWSRLFTCPELPTYENTAKSIHALKNGWNQLDPGFLDNSEFRPFFKFCFEFNREGTKKFLERDTAIILLPLCIENRSFHTDAFIQFLEKEKTPEFKLNKDQWCSFLDFSLAVGSPPDFDGWNADESSWPILLDEFVEYVKANNSLEKSDKDQASSSPKTTTTTKHHHSSTKKIKIKIIIL